MKRWLIVLLLALMPSVVAAQIKTTTTEKLALLGVTSPIVQGNRILVGADSNVAVSPVVILDVETGYKFKRLKARRDGQRIEPEALSETQYLFAGKGRYVVEVTVFDPEKGIDETELSFEIGGTPDPEPEPGPGPDPGPEPGPGPEPPTGPFDNLAIRVAALSIRLTADQRTKWVTTLETVIKKMETFEFRRVDDARTFIRGAGLTDPNLNRLLEDDARTRLLSFAETVAWYKEVLKGLK
jgi:hypothetical protein